MDNKESQLALFFYLIQNITSDTNQHKDVIAQREFSASEARSLNAPALMTFTTSMWLATNEGHSDATFKFVYTVSEALKLALWELFWLPTSSLNNFPIEPLLLKLLVSN
ncbi:hypothetical protein [Shewanella waksmanii]|uniref:hypothetical protein n=1 Tax=Shewanella waksmanii TaxID=213783 RepID=UPI00373522B6